MNRLSQTIQKTDLLIPGTTNKYFQSIEDKMTWWRGQNAIKYCNDHRDDPECPTPITLSRIPGGKSRRRRNKRSKKSRSNKKRKTFRKKRVYRR